MCSAAARFSDPISHTSTAASALKMLGSLVVGAVIGAAVTALVVAAAVATVATGGLGLVAVLAIGFVVSAAMEGSGLNAFIDRTIDHAVDSVMPPVIEGKIVSGSPDVNINSLKAARAAAPSMLDVVACAKHASGPPPMIAQGSNNVFINSQPAARVNDKITCGGTIAGGSPNVFIGGGTLTVRDIDDERPWWLTALGVGIGVALTLCGRGKMNWSALKSALPCLGMNMAASMAGSWVGHQIKTAIGNPVNVITGGKVLQEEPDFSLPAALPLDWARFYSSHDGRSEGLFGPGWSVAWEVQLRLERDPANQLCALHYTDEQGRLISFPPVAPGTSHFSIAEGYYLICTEAGQYLVESVDGIYRDFGVPAAGFVGVCKLQRLEERNGNWHALRYDAHNRLYRINDAVGRRLALAYDPIHPKRVAAITLAKGFAAEPAEVLVQYRYSALGELAEVVDRTGQTIRRFAYSQGSQGLMSEHSAPQGLHCYYQWQGTGTSARVIRHWTDDGESYQFEYDLTRQNSTVVDQSGRSQHWQWNGDCQPTSYTDGEGHVWQYTWNEYRQLLTLTDPLQAVTRCEYDEQGRLSTTINALEQLEKTAWHDRFDLPLFEIDAAGNRWAYEYDRQGNLTSVTDPLGHRTEHHYDQQGLLHTVRDARGGHSHYAWNVAAQITSHTDCSGQQTHFSYDARGALASVTDAAGNATHYQSDALGRVTEIITPDGSRQQFAYDALGRLITSIDANQRSTHYQRNRRGLLIERINAMGHVVRFRYDAAQRLSQLQNENGESYRFEYDKNDRLIQEIGLDGSIKKIVHDARGLPIQVTDAYGSDAALTHHMQRDALGRLIRKHSDSARSTIIPITTSYRYDQIGQLLQAQRYTQKGEPGIIHDDLQFGYSQRGEIVREAGHLGQLQHEYDELGNRISTTLPDGRVINHLYYGSGHLHQINIDGETISDIERDELHREVLRTQGKLTSRFGYDKLGRKTAHQLQRNQQHDPVLQKQWLYDRAGEMVQKRNSKHGTMDCRYDPLGRIASASQTGKLGQIIQHELFQYDAAANLVDQAGAVGYVKHNRVMVFEDKRFQYDQHGRLQTKLSGSHTRQHFSYDDEHRLCEVQTTSSGLTQSVKFAYDALGRRIKKTDDFGTTHFLWDGLRILQEQRGNAGTTYVYEPGSYVPLARLDRATTVVAANDASHGAAKSAEKKLITVDRLFYFHNDVSGMPEELTGSKGEIAWQAQYSTWGNTVSESWTIGAQEQIENHGTRPLPQNLRFQGQYLDREIGLHYNTFRFYDPDIGRFITPDPIGLMGGDNLYSYAPNPINWIDPLGWCAFSSLPPLRGKSVSNIEKILQRIGFNRSNPNNQSNRTWRHGDGSEVRVHQHGNAAPSGFKSGNNAHVHKQSTSGQQLNDMGIPSTNAAETHIGIKNPSDLPTVRGRPHGDGS